MTPPPVDTFEHDIADEIRRKEASIEDIASATGDIKNKPIEEITKKDHSVLISIVTILTLCGVVGAGYVGYLYYVEGPTPTSKASQEEALVQQKKLSSTTLSSMSPALDKAIGGFLTNVEKTSNGYSIEIVSYSPVFAYMIKNESEFGDEIALAVGNTHTIKNATTTPVSTTPIINASSSATSTQINGTSTTINTIETPPSLPTEYIFSDITISNQNMRVATSVYGTVVYAFIGTKKLVISKSTDGILALRSNILHK